MLALQRARRAAVGAARAGVPRTPRRGMALPVRPYLHKPDPEPDTPAYRFAPKTSEHKFTGASNALTWDPAKGMPPKVNETNYRKQNTYAVVHSANPKPTAATASAGAAAAAAASGSSAGATAAAAAASKPLSAFTSRPHFYARNDTRAFHPASVPRAADHNLTTPFHRPSLHSLLQRDDTTTVVHTEVSRAGVSVADALHRATRHFPPHLRAAMRQHMFDAKVTDQNARVAVAKEFAALDKAAARRLKAVQTGDVLAADAAAAHRAAYEKSRLSPEQMGAVTAVADAAGSGATVEFTPVDAEYVRGAVNGDGSEKFAATPTRNVVDAGAAGAANADAAAAAASADPIALTWKVLRTPMKNLPVYRAYRNGRTRTVTSLRNFRGNVKDLRLAVQSVVGPDVAVVQRLGRIDILGNHSQRIKVWLAALGF